MNEPGDAINNENVMANYCGIIVVINSLLILTLLNPDFKYKMKHAQSVCVGPCFVPGDEIEVYAQDLII